MASRASQPLAYGSIFAGALLLIAGVTGSTIPSVAQGKPDKSKALPPPGGDGAGGVSGAVQAGTSAPSASIPGARVAPTPAEAAAAALPGKGGKRVHDQAIFGAALSKFTGLDKGVVAKWMLAEQPAGQSALPGSNNWLNIETGVGGGSGVGSRSDRAVARLDPVSAARVTAQWIARNQPSILRSARSSPKAQERAIVNSGWAASHYGGHL